MNNYNFPEEFRALYEKAVARYGDGCRSAGDLFDAKEAAWLSSNGLTAQNLFDYAEDDSNYGEPGFDRALTIEQVRRDYFVNEQCGRASGRTIDESGLPAKTDAVGGIAWLPRLIPKARAKLRGELPPSLMYCCGGDRKFFKEHDLNPAEFLGIVWRKEDDRDVVDWMLQRSGRPAGSSGTKAPAR